MEREGFVLRAAWGGKEQDEGEGLKKFSCGGKALNSYP
jgi:hypothetical protein